jgi:putative oxidoreductase
MDARLQARIMAIGRLLMAMIFILSGLSKIGAGALVAFGYRTRVVALLLAGFCPLSAAIFHHQFADQVQVIMFLKNISMAGGFLLLAAVGPGSLGLDARFGRA